MKKPVFRRSSIKSYITPEGETIERKVRRIEVDNEPIKDGSPIIYTEKADGVKPEYNVRTDRFEVAATAMDIVHKNETAKGNKGAPSKEPDNKGKENGNTQSENSGE